MRYGELVQESWHAARFLSVRLRSEPGAGRQSVRPRGRIAKSLPRQGSSAAATTLVEDTHCAPASFRAQAADSIFNHAAKAIEIEDIQVRVAALEQARRRKDYSDEVKRNALIDAQKELSQR